MDQQRLQERIAAFLKALGQLERAARQPKDEFLRDSVIQRFEFTHELAWKMLKLRLEAELVLARTPKETLQEALKAGFIDDGSGWSALQRMRNLTSHTYDESLAETVYAFAVGEGLALYRQLAQQARSWRTPE